MCAKLLPSCLGDPTDCGPPGSSVHGICHARILGWVAVSFSRASIKRSQNYFAQKIKSESWITSNSTYPTMAITFEIKQTVELYEKYGDLLTKLI